MRAFRVGLYLFAAFSSSVEFAAAHGPMTPWVRLAQAQQQQCSPWQVRDDNGNCTNAPNSFFPGVGYTPAAGETRWAECECYNGQSPAADNCAPCSFVGQACLR